MVGPRKIKETVVENGSFMGVKFPEFKGVTVELSSTKDVFKSVKTGEVLEETSPNFKIMLKLVEFNNRREDIELSFKIQEATQLKFAPYYKNGGYYSFYTTGYQSTETKAKIFKDLIELISAYVEEKKYEVIVFKEDFKEDYENNFTLETRDMLLMPYHAKDVTPMFLVVLKDKVSSEAYSYLKRESFYSGYLSPNKEEEENQSISASFYNVQQYFPDFKRKNGFFLIPPSSYSIVKTYLQSEVAKDNFYFEEQLKKAQKFDVNSVEYDEKNIFGISIKYVEDKGVFLFQGKGYKDGASIFHTGRGGTYSTSSNRTLLGLWANNFIYAEKLSENEIEDKKITSKDFFIEDSNKIELTFLPGGSAKDGYLVPVSDYEKLLTIKQNVEKENKIWGRQDLLIDIFKEFSFDNAWSVPYPVIMITESGTAYLCHTRRQKKSKEKTTLECTTFKGVEITQEEVNYLLNEHPFSSDIAKLSKDITILSSSSIKEIKDFNILSEQEKSEMFETLLLHYNLKQETKFLDEIKSTGKKLKF